MILRSFLLLIFLLNILWLSGQSPELLEASGAIPKEFLTSSSVKYEKAVEKLSKSKASRKKQKDSKAFLLQSNFAVDDILQSGIVLFNDPATQYVNEVLQQIPIENRRLKRKNVKAYVMNSSAVNAFATDQGIIFVTLGLLARLENEAQLAFILCHELMHVRHQHAVDQFLKGKDIDREQNKERNFQAIEFDQALLEKSLYSRQLEEKADEGGFELFSKTNYDPKVLPRVFEILHYSYLPVKNEKFNLSFFEDQYYKLGLDLFLKEVRPIEAMKDMEDEEEEQSSHPSSFKRLEKINQELEQIDATDKNVFILPSARFEAIQKKAHYQIPFLQVRDGDFVSAIYNSYVLLQIYPDDVELEKVIGRSLYMLAKLCNHDASFKNRITSQSKKQEGELHALYHLFDKTFSTELMALAMKYNWKVYQKGEFEDMEDMMKDISIEFLGKFGEMEDFISDEQEAKNAIALLNDESLLQVDSTNNSVQEDYVFINDAFQDSTVVQPLQKEKTISEHSEPKISAYWKYAFVKELNDEAFQKYLEEGRAYSSNRKEEGDFYDSEEGKDYLQKSNEKERKFGKQLGIDKIIVINPFYLSLDERKDGVVQFIRSEKQQAFFSKRLEQIAKVAKLDLKLLDIATLQTSEAENLMTLLLLINILNTK